MAEKGRRVSASSENSDSEKDATETPASDLVLTKYSMAADIVNAVMKARELVAFLAHCLYLSTSLNQWSFDTSTLKTPHFGGGGMGYAVCLQRRIVGALASSEISS
ncbi:unnamed protein product [Gongylonema pulchrum]|uniref:Uncharacterized protein n=1 Tax=Gongylonema pulchrum TaxID=637853 RepID=A0A183EM82_9BILA|nr:unnamed protein product [Gongylonema pulchrum]